jgi:hypothetical protein
MKEPASTPKAHSEIRSNRAERDLIVDLNRIRLFLSPVFEEYAGLMKPAVRSTHPGYVVRIIVLWRGFIVHGNIASVAERNLRHARRTRDKGHWILPLVRLANPRFASATISTSE